MSKSSQDEGTRKPTIPSEQTGTQPPVGCRAHHHTPLEIALAKQRDEVKARVVRLVQWLTALQACIIWTLYYYYYYYFPISQKIGCKKQFSEPMGT
jgi:hypothetical protein